eukprot:TRINITY_DN34916_c0_g1_i1.p1 TRINITY_DN34916_c0_g1~~TRINITY_DN34916_c0_g1_i1.p1  ORF type:complete len:145 (+),score=26.52 TRINITY_DN34916_c0_g1_i1:40-435(+)
MKKKPGGKKLPSLQCSISKANNSWAVTEPGERKDVLLNGKILDSPRRTLDAVWGAKDTFDRSRYRTMGNTALRDSYILDCTTESNRKNWQVRYTSTSSEVAPPNLQCLREISTKGTKPAASRYRSCPTRHI